MRILVVHHGVLPSPGQPASGGAIRAWHLGRGLAAAGLEVHHLARDQDVPGGFASPADLVRKAAALRPDAVVTVQLEDAPPLRALGVPVVVDLYAPRLLEAPFAGAQADTAPAVLRALRAGDVFLTSSPRQAWSWLGVLALAGVDVRQDPTLAVPIASSAPARRRRSKDLVLVGGGGAWPWTDPVPAVVRALAWMDQRDAGRLVWYGEAAHLPEHPRLERRGRVAWDALLADWAGATALFDWQGEHPERQLALGFRHADALAAGLPVLGPSGTAVAEGLGDAAWTGDVESTLDAVLDDLSRGGDERQRRSDAARALALQRDAQAAAAPLARWLQHGTPSHRAPPGPLLDLAELSARAASAEARAGAAEDRAARAEAEAVGKRQELAEAQARVHTLLSTVDRLSRAVDEVAAFKREAVDVLGRQVAAAADARDGATDQLGRLRADLAKKDAELVASSERLAQDRDAREAMQTELDRLRAAHAAHTEELASLRSELRRKDTEIAGLAEQISRLQAECTRASEALERARREPLRRI